MTPVYLLLVSLCLLSGLCNGQTEAVGEAQVELPLDQPENSDQETSLDESHELEGETQDCCSSLYEIGQDVGTLTETLRSTIRRLDETISSLEASEDQLAALNNTLSTVLNKAPPGPDHGNHTEDGGVNNWQTFNGRGFRFIQSAITWAEAQKHCVSLGGNLATIHNQQEGQFVNGVAKGRAAWIGFSDAQQDGVWLWINSKPVTFTGWCDGEPNNYHGPQQCALINFTANKCWDDERCLVKRPFVCEKEL